MRWPWSDRRESSPVLNAKRMATRKRDETLLDTMVEAEERAELQCLDCEIGEPHACEREWWRKVREHRRGRCCSDEECVCREAAGLEREAAGIRADLADAARQFQLNSRAERAS